jgi:hypothetical protein
LLLLLVVGAGVAALGDLPFFSWNGSWLLALLFLGGSWLLALLLLDQMVALQASIALVWWWCVGMGERTVVFSWWSCVGRMVAATLGCAYSPPAGLTGCCGAASS